MKKIIYLAFLAMSLNVVAQTKGIGLGINAGIPIGNIEDSFSVAFGADVNYLYSITDEIDLGAATGLVFFNGKEVNGVKPENKIYVPIAGSVRFNNDGESFFVGGDFGYAIGVSPDGDEGGFYFKPILGYNFNDTFSLNVFYTGIKKKQPTFGYAGAGLMVRL